jgi:hypothetical protein
VTPLIVNVLCASASGVQSVAGIEINMNKTPVNNFLALMRQEALAEKSWRK